MGGWRRGGDLEKAGKRGGSRLGWGRGGEGTGKSWGKGGEYDQNTLPETLNELKKETEKKKKYKPSFEKNGKWAITLQIATTVYGKTQVINDYGPFNN